MKLSLIARRNKKIFESKINKKSYFLRSLPKKKYEGIKKIEEGKTDLIIDKILGLGEFERDYGFFCNQKNENDRPKNIILTENVKSSLKNKINMFIQKENPNIYENYRYEEDNNKNYNTIEHKYNNNKYWRPKKIAVSPMPINNSKQNLIKKQNTFLSSVGNNIITSKSMFDKENSKNNN